MYRYRRDLEGIEVGTGVTMISNVRAENADIALQAAEASGIPVQVSPIAMDIDGRQVNGYVALWAPAYTECGPFWEEYHRLEAEQCLKN